ncbi:MAG TPA: prepilin peptidase [Egibacteraceae bacterium]|nr:prepilin peptidase [Egibacteraceae bacterium]
MELGMEGVALAGGLFLLGLVFGSFANVVIHRLPEGGSLVSPPSSCPSCGERISPKDNVPVLSWLLLRGRCRGCAAPISRTYPIVELAMGALFALVGWRIGATWALLGYLLFAWTLLVVAVIDLRTRRIPNRLTYPLTPVLLGLMVVAALLGGQPSIALRSLFGGLAAFGALLVLALISPRGMGMGDVKLAAFIGVGLGYLGWAHVLLGIFGAFLVGGVIAIGLLLTGMRKRKDQIPFGPYMAVSAMLALLAGQPLIDAYVRATGLG